MHKERKEQECKQKNNKQVNNEELSNNKYTIINVCTVVPFLIAIAISAVLLVMYSVYKYGSAITHDSVAYIYAAESFLTKKGMIYFGYTSPFIQWPPLFPFVLAGLKAIGANLLVASAYFNAIIYASIILVSGIWVLKATKNGVFSVMTSLAMLASIPLYYVSRFIWSETLFIFFTLLFLITLDIHINHYMNIYMKHFNCKEHSNNCKPSLKYLIIASTLAAFACLTRYIGVTLVITGAIILMLQKKKFLNRFLELILFGTISSTPTIIWVGRNYALTGTLTGGRSPSKNCVSENTAIFFERIALWITPGDSKNMAYLILGILVFISLIIIFINVLANKKEKDIPYSSSNPSSNSRFRTQKNINKIIILLVFFSVYSMYLILSASKVSFDTINDRLISPIYPAIILLIMFTVHTLINTINKRKLTKILSVIIVVLLFSSWIIYPFTEIIEEANYSYENGAGILASKWWEQSPLIEYINNLPSNSIICSNCPDAVYIHTNKTSIYPPKKEGIDLYRINQFENTVAKNENVYIAWFNVNIGESMYNVDELSECFAIEMVDNLYDGIIYKVTNKTSIK